MAVWENGELITAEKLNKSSVFMVDVEFDQVYNASSDVTYQEILEAVQNGKTPIVRSKKVEPYDANLYQHRWIPLDALIYTYEHYAVFALNELIFDTSTDKFNLQVMTITFREDTQSGQTTVTADIVQKQIPTS